MVTIVQGGDPVTLINVSSREPQNQQHLIDSWVRVTEERLGELPGIVLASRHRSKDGTRVVNYAQWKSSENWKNLYRIGRQSWFQEMRRYVKPDAHLYEVCYQLDKTESGRGDL